MKMIKGINHVGIVVKNIDEVLSLLREAFGAEEVHRMEIPVMKQISSIVRIGDDCFELMEPTGPDGPAGSFLEAKGGGLHHVSLLCDDVEVLCEKLESQGLKIIGKVLEGPFRVAFLHPGSAKGVLYELTDTPSLG
jgi:methylmalonyl-CoA/ethylmalonyl-CoA epimerase